jgi:hypothetical protein
MGGPVRGQQQIQVFAGRPSVPELKLHRLPLLHNISDGHRSCLLIGADEIPDEKIPSLEAVPLLVDYDAKMKRSMGAPTVFSRQGFKHGLQPLQCRHAPEFVYEIVLGLRDNIPVPDQAASLRYDRPHIDGAGQANAHQPPPQHFILEDQAILVRVLPTTRQSSDRFDARIPFINELEDFLHGGCEGVGQQKKGRVGYS